MENYKITESEPVSEYTTLEALGDSHLYGTPLLVQFEESDEWFLWAAETSVMYKICSDINDSDNLRLRGYHSDYTGFGRVVKYKVVNSIEFFVEGS